MRIKQDLPTYVNLFAHRIFGAWKETRFVEEKIREFMIHAANSVRIAIDAGNLDASLRHCLHRIASLHGKVIAY
jgi:hypothetical protein